MIYIYQLINKINGKTYIGKTINIKKRMYKHYYLAEKGLNRPLSNALRKYGVENFQIHTIEKCTDDEVDNRERFWIRVLKTRNKLIGYNIAKGGEGGDILSNHPNKKEIISKIVKKNKGKKRSEEHCKRMSEIHKGKAITKKQREQISTTLKRKYKNGEIKKVEHTEEAAKRLDRTGSKHNEATKAKMSADRKGKTYEERYGKEVALRMKENKKKLKGNKSPSYKTIDKNKLLKAVLTLKIEDVAKMFNVSKPTIYTRVKEFTGLTPDKYRKENYDN